MIVENFEPPEQIYPNISCKHHMDSLAPFSETDVIKHIRKSSSVFSQPDPAPTWLIKGYLNFS